jgi:hypothetical protein
MHVSPTVLALLLTVASDGEAGPPVDYARDVKPILTARCTSCHGAIRQKAGLRLDTAELLRRGGHGGPAIEPGKSAESPLIERVTGAEGVDRMPPESEGVPLSPQEVTTLRAWIDQGAKAPLEPTPEDPKKHWAYRPPARPPVPTSEHPAAVRNPIDALLLAAQRARGLSPASAVSPDLWLRRVSLDLIGLPPTRDELMTFRADTSPDARGKVVDRLLADPRHGERWGRHWMDVWRYSDWYGLGAEVRYSHPHIWHWRDWIVESINSDKGYDRMVVEMLAGDELEPQDPDTVRATGFLARNWDIFNRNVWLANTVEHTARAFLGVTIQCARCHDHKFDPVSQVEYYRLRAFFEPYHVRIDRVAGEPDRTKAGLPRVFDDFLETPTYRFIRGDESQPDKTRPLTPATPAILGGETPIRPISLPVAAYSPDKRPFVVRETWVAAETAVAQAKSSLEAAQRQVREADKALTAAIEGDRQVAAKVAAVANKVDELKAAQTAAAASVEHLARARLAASDAKVDRDLAEAAPALAEAKFNAIKALLNVERLEDDGARTSGSESWTEAARSTVAAQREAAVIESTYQHRSARRDVIRAERALDGLLAAAVNVKDDPMKDARAKAAAAVVDARGRLAAAEQQIAKAETAAKAPIGTEYVPRALEFPRAKITYRDTPSNAPYAKISSGRRLALARWIVDRRNPLAARVAVNHVWARHFGEPLVASTYDFGLRTGRPDLLELLDWLAVDFMESGWSMKHLHKIIVTSRAYAMGSADSGQDDQNVRIDPDNHLVWRMSSRRMDAEVVRDSILALAGRLDSAIGGADLPVAAAEAGNRRTLYYRFASGDTIPLLAMFDAPSVEECYRRHETIVPQQALALTNSAMVLNRSTEIATRLSQDIGNVADSASRSAFMLSAYEHILGRPPTDAERAECEAGIARLAEVYVSEGPKPGPSPESRARSALVHVLLNHNDFITIR